MPIETFDTSFESTKDKQHYGTKINYIEESKSYSDYNLFKKNLVSIDGLDVRFRLIANYPANTSDSNL